MVKNIVAVSITHLIELEETHPFETPAWDCAPFTAADVLGCTAPDPGPFDFWPGATPSANRDLHIARIAAMVRSWRNDGSDAPELMVYKGTCLIDGWHRFAAAIIRGDQELFVELTGNLAEAPLHGLPSVNTGSSATDQGEPASAPYPTGVDGA